MLTHMCIYTYTCAYTHRHVHMRVYMRIHTYMCIRICACMYLCLYKCICDRAKYFPYRVGDIYIAASAQQQTPNLITYEQAIEIARVRSTCDATRATQSTASLVRFGHMLDGRIGSLTCALRPQA